MNSLGDSCFAKGARMNLDDLEAWGDEESRDGGRKGRLVGATGLQEPGHCDAGAFGAFDNSNIARVELDVCAKTCCERRLNAELSENEADDKNKENRRGREAGGRATWGHRCASR